ncbi:hypothetical protein [Liquorilactobacillus hordei]|uniref:Uncharacterized protein n=1 Tax=Liquorilactobacillus hordei DSM 19519 TaxID=1423759 RepID=A0A0R1M6Z1_9LACO|nr:hypothetical protein [Liquorilactobacillus hordei]KRL03903.1 hypothetical protein FC92_GL001928 [Liquorilactobacillus hordei DSM 19519]QYH53021.1 hypothetical protein G6O70_11810 [Liquorilactobacillus hordei DSM 19519]
MPKNVGVLQVKQIEQISKPKVSMSLLSSLAEPEGLNKQFRIIDGDVCLITVIHK